ncbi:HAD-like domain-containing protein [Pseudoneurospora amorphoporcata]|uniref:HAD-like domain-containing protein n=1 Tax=Pseudoneurospora amorphoporcata TaxID=241081 RepID=A0AAN6P6E3_9PEZI|nr:HAD-like domain-containing protein [Pseudoneurospora amorphoporcata]
MPATHQPPPWATEIKALTFDVFGTCVAWREKIVSALASTTESKLSSASSSASTSSDTPPSEQVLSRARSLTREDWARFAQEWRRAYGGWTRSFVPDETPWRDIDTFHHESLIDLLAKWQLDGLFTPFEVEKLSLTWHDLPPWPDTIRGLQLLGSRYRTAALSNANQAILKDLNNQKGVDGSSPLGFQRLLSCDMYQAYKPSPKVYQGAVRDLGLQPGEVAMVAAHLGDLEAAKKKGMRAIYVAKPGELEFDADVDKIKKARDWVDLWVEEGEGGMVEAARRLGINVDIDVGDVAGVLG